MIWNIPNACIRSKTAVRYSDCSCLFYHGHLRIKEYCKILRSTRKTTCYIVLLCGIPGQLFKTVPMITACLLYKANTWPKQNNYAFIILCTNSRIVQICCKPVMKANHCNMHYVCTYNVCICIMYNFFVQMYT